MANDPAGVGEAGEDVLALHPSEQGLAVRAAAGEALRMAPHEDAIPFSSRCELCSEKNFDTHWIDVGPEGEGISCVTVDVTLRLCPAHRARLLQALGRADSERVEPNREMKGW